MTKLIEESENPFESFGSSRTKSSNIKELKFNSIATADDSVNLSEPSSETHSEYPYNNVEVSKSGHVKEIDDTPGAERIFEMHKSGTYYEISSDGTRISKVFGDEWEISLNDKNVVIGGNLNITVQGDANILVKGNVKNKIGGNLEQIVHGDYNLYVDGQTNIKSNKSCTIQTNSSLNTKSIKDTNIYSESDNNIESKNITYIDGSQVHFNKPGPGANSENLKLSKGLSIPDSLVEPTFEYSKIKGINFNYNVDISETATFPKNRDL